MSRSRPGDAPTRISRRLGSRRLGSRRLGYRRLGSRPAAAIAAPSNRCSALGAAAAAAVSAPPPPQARDMHTLEQRPGNTWAVFAQYRGESPLATGLRARGVVSGKGGSTARSPLTSGPLERGAAHGAAVWSAGRRAHVAPGEGWGGCGGARLEGHGDVVLSCDMEEGEGGEEMRSGDLGAGRSGGAADMQKGNGQASAGDKARALDRGPAPCPSHGDNQARCCSGQLASSVMDQRPVDSTAAAGGSKRRAASQSADGYLSALCGRCVVCVNRALHCERNAPDSDQEVI